MVHVISGKRASAAVAFGLALLVANAGLGSSLVRATSPCDSITGDPNPPIGSPEPDIIGHILASGTNVGISGATVRLYVCDGSTPSLVASTTTTSGGLYGFPDLSGPAWYFVQAVITGPLAGKTPSQGTSNPTDLIDVGPGATGVDLTFE